MASNHGDREPSKVIIRVNTSDKDTSSKADHYSQYLLKLREHFLENYKKSYISNSSITAFTREKVLGTGGFGIVYLVKHNATNKYYAMKSLEKEKVVRYKQIEHTYSEMKILCAVNFPFVVNMKFYFKDNVYLYFVLPFVAGGELFSYLQKAGKFQENVSKFYASQVLLALEYLHACDLVYRDLKPENILIDITGYIKITDFGFCKVVKDRTWTLCGTPEYLAPEIILSRGYGKAVDWWSFGILIFEMTSGNPPFYASDPMQTYESIVAGKYFAPAYFSPELKDILSKLLQTDITRRLGNLKNGALDIKDHKWLQIMDWEKIVNRRLPPPIVPKIKDPADTSNFDEYNEEKPKECSYCLYEEQFMRF